jgi:hypothetical protein
LMNMPAFNLATRTPPIHLRFFCPDGNNVSTHWGPL